MYRVLHTFPVSSNFVLLRDIGRLCTIWQSQAISGRHVRLTVYQYLVATIAALQGDIMQLMVAREDPTARTQLQNADKLDNNWPQKLNNKRCTTSWYSFNLCFTSRSFCGSSNTFTHAVPLTCFLDRTKE